MSSLSISGLQVTRGSLQVLRSVDLEVRTGEIVALMGPSGSGKTTILRTVAALQPFQSGAISIGDVVLKPGHLPRQSQLAGLRSKVGMVFQEHALFEHLPVIENVTLAPIHVRGWSRDRAAGAATELLHSLGVAERSHAFPRELSGGQAQRVAIARALVLDPDVLLMDEPTSALDPARRVALAETLRKLVDGARRSLLISTHDSDFAESCADRVVMLDNGVIVH